MAEAAVKARLKRTRTGCFKCRVRRRKCDEEKPSCQRCVDGGFECQYGTKLSFLQKNAKTSSESRDANYPKLRHNEATLSEPDKAANSSIEKETEVQPPPPATISSNIETFVTSPQTLPTDLLSPTSAAYETALDGLLSLGHYHYTFSSAPTVSQTGADGGLFISYPHQIQFGVSDKLREDVFLNCLHMPQDRAVELLRHYRYNIAPWLDINDTGQTFGLIVPRVAMDSIPLLNSLLSFSLVTLGKDTHFDLTGHSILPDHNPRIVAMSNALTFTFTTLNRQFVTQPTSWPSPSKNIGCDSINSASFQNHYPSIALAASWLILRLDVSVSLMNGSPVSIPSMVSYEASSPLSRIYREPLKCGREPVLLCAQVLNYCFGDAALTSPEVIRPPAAQRWKSLSEALSLWYTSRPRYFKPMIEFEDNEQLFPLVLFTNGAAILANQLYHTSMLLLLQNRPRTLPKEHGRNVSLSPLWHAQRICGISLNNDTRINWDFSLLASFYLAAKRMTYEPQQNAILRGIDRIGSLTGWNVNTLSTQLVHEWQPDQG